MILVSLSDVGPGMVLGVGLRNREGHTVLGAGVTLTPDYTNRLRTLGYQAVWIDDEDTSDILYDDVLSEKARTAATRAIQDTLALAARETDNLRGMSVDQVRSNLEDRRLHQVVVDSGVLERITGEVDMLVGEVLDRSVLTGLASLRTHDNDSYTHCLDVTVTAIALGRRLGYDQDALKTLAVGCMLHDIGNLFLDGDTLHKQAPKDDDNGARAREHTTFGYLLLRDSLRVGIVSAHIAYQHHEFQDGLGYPRGLTGTNRIVQGRELHLPGRITPLAEVAAIANFHDECASPNRGGAPSAPDRAWHLVREAAGTRLNHEMVDRLLHILPPYPRGTQVMVTDGRFAGHVGVVARLDEADLTHPVIRILKKPDGTRIEPVDIDLKKIPVEIRSLQTAPVA